MASCRIAVQSPAAEATLTSDNVVSTLLSRRSTLEVMHEDEFKKQQLSLLWVHKTAASKSLSKGDDRKEEKKILSHVQKFQKSTTRIKRQRPTRLSWTGSFHERGRDGLPNHVADRAARITVTSPQHRKPSTGSPHHDVHHVRSRFPANWRPQTLRSKADSPSISPFELVSACGDPFAGAALPIGAQAASYLQLSFQIYSVIRPTLAAYILSRTIQDEAWLHVGIGVTAGMMRNGLRARTNGKTLTTIGNNFSHQPHELEYLQRTTRGIGLIKERVHARIVSDATILAISYLAQIEGYPGNERVAEAHFNGLHGLVRARGGFEALPPLVRLLVASCDVQFATFWARKTRLWSPPGKADRRTGAASALLNLQTYTTCTVPVLEIVALDRITAHLPSDLLELLRNFIQHVVFGQIRDQWLLSLQDRITIYLGRSYLHLSLIDYVADLGTAADRRADACRWTALLFFRTSRRGYPPAHDFSFNNFHAPAHALFRSLRSRPFQPSLCDLALSCLFVGAHNAFDPALHQSVVEEIADLVTLLGCSCWKEVKMLVEPWFFVEEVYDRQILAEPPEKIVLEDLQPLGLVWPPCFPAYGQVGLAVLYLTQARPQHFHLYLPFSRDPEPRQDSHLDN